jgi:hypothetical protein
LPPEEEERRSSFSLFAAYAIAKLGISPVALPQPVEYCPHWATICELEVEPARKEGISQDLSDTVPHGLDKIDVDAVDPCTRAWLEALRQKSPAFRFNQGTETIKETKYETLSGAIEDVCAASIAYIQRRARDEIGDRLAGVTGKTSPDPAPSRPAPKEIVDAAKPRGRWSYERLAGRIQISRDTLSAIIREKRWVSDDVYARVAKFCSCRPEDLHPRDLPARKPRRPR